MSKFAIRTCGVDEVRLLLSWARAEGWNPGLHDLTPFLVADPLGFFVGTLGGEPVAGISAVRYGASFGFLGLYITTAEHRGKGHGIQLWNRALEHLGKRTVGLDGVVAQQENYARSGFELAYRQIRFGGPAPDVNAPADLVPIGQVPFGMLDGYDSRMFPSARTHFLSAWVTMPESMGWAYLEEGDIRGFGVRRACNEGFKIGPLFAENAQIAEHLVHGLIADVAGQHVFLDVPEPNKPGVKLAESLGLAAVFETARMYRGEARELPVDQIFGVTTFELG